MGERGKLMKDTSLSWVADCVNCTLPKMWETDRPKRSKLWATWEYDPRKTRSVIAITLTWQETDPETGQIFFYEKRRLFTERSLSPKGSPDKYIRRLKRVWRMLMRETTVRKGLYGESAWPA